MCSFCLIYTAAQTVLPMDPTSTVRAAVAVGVDDDAHPDGRPEKRQRVEEEQHEHEEAHDDGGPAPPPPQQLSQALHKIANYISNSAKFAKASQLLRQVMDAVDKSHRCVCVVACPCSLLTSFLPHCLHQLTADTQHPLQR